MKKMIYSSVLLLLFIGNILAQDYEIETKALELSENLRNTQNYTIKKKIEIIKTKLQELLQFEKATKNTPDDIVRRAMQYRGVAWINGWIVFSNILKKYHSLSQKDIQILIGTSNTSVLQKFIVTYKQIDKSQQKFFLLFHKYLIDEKKNLKSQYQSIQKKFHSLKEKKDPLHSVIYSHGNHQYFLSQDIKMDSVSFFIPTQDHLFSKNNSYKFNIWKLLNLLFQAKKISIDEYIDIEFAIKKWIKNTQNPITNKKLNEQSYSRKENRENRENKLEEALQEMIQKNIPNKSKSKLHPIPKLNQTQKKQIALIIKEVERKWTNLHGFLLLKASIEKKDRPDNENPVLFTSEYLYILWRLGVLKGKLFDFYRDRVKSMIAKLRLEPGLFNRYPGKTQDSFDRHFSRDEQIGLVVMDFLFQYQLGFSKELYEYGKRNHFCYQNRTWSASGHHNRKARGKHTAPLKLYFTSMRQPELIEFFRTANGEKQTLRGQKAFCSALKMTKLTPYGNTSGKIMAFLRCEIMYGRRKETDEVIQNFLQWMSIIYKGNPIHAIFSIYYREKNHPIRRLSSMLVSQKASHESTSKQQVTTINIPIKLPLGQLEKDLNKKIEPFFKRHIVPITNKKHKLGKLKVHADILVKQDSPIKLTGRGEKLEVSIPISFDASVHGLFKAIARFRHHVKIRGKLEIKANIQAKLTNNWQLKIDNGFHIHWREKPHIDVFRMKVLGKKISVKIRITKIFNKLLQKEFRKINKKFSNVNVRNKIKKALKKLQNGIALPGKKTKVFINIYPQSLSFSPLFFTPKNIVTHARFIGKIKVSLKNQKPISLPKLLSIKDKRTDSQLNIGIFIPFKEFSEIIKRELKKKISKAKISFENIKLFKSKKSLIFQIKIKSNNFSSNVYIIFDFSIEKQIFKINKIEVHPAIMAKKIPQITEIGRFLIRDSYFIGMDIPLKPLMKSLVKIANQNLSKSIYQAITLKTKVKKISINNFYLQKNGIFLNISIKSYFSIFSQQ